MSIDGGKPPFESLPSGLEIAKYFWWDTDHRNSGYDGIDLWRDGTEYCYLWVETAVDFDLNKFYLLEIRTHTDDVETRDYLYLSVGVLDGRFDVEWDNNPAPFFDAPPGRHRERFAKAMRKLVSITERTFEEGWVD